MNIVFLVLNTAHLQPPRGCKLVVEPATKMFSAVVKSEGVFARVDGESTTECRRVFSAVARKFVCKIVYSKSGDGLVVSEGDVIVLLRPWTFGPDGRQAFIDNTIQYSIDQLSKMAWTKEYFKVVRRARRRTFASSPC